MAEGLCRVCPTPLSEDSIQYCDRHLQLNREYRQKKNRESKAARALKASIERAKKKERTRRYWEEVVWFAYDNTIEATVEKYGIHKNTIYLMARNLNLKLSFRKKPRNNPSKRKYGTPEERREIAEYAVATSARRAGQKYNIADTTVLRYKKEFGLLEPASKKKGT